MTRQTKDFGKWLDREVEKRAKEEQKQLDKWLDLNERHKEFELGGAFWCFIMGEKMALESPEARK